MLPREKSPEWCPWVEADRTNIRVVLTQARGACLGTSLWSPPTIYIQRGLGPAQARCILARELLRLHWGRTTGTSPLVVVRHEKALIRQAARLLIPIGDLVETIRWAPTGRDQAAALMVDLATLQARLRSLTEPEWSAVTSIVQVSA